LSATNLKWLQAICSKIFIQSSVQIIEICCTIKMYKQRTGEGLVMKLVGYVRVSSESQEDNTSLADQQRRIKSYCDAFGHELLEVFIEVASGKDTDNRPQFQSALARLKGDADGIVAIKLDRIARNCRDVLELVEDTLQPANKALVLLDLHVDTSTPTGKMILTMMAAVAELERAQINERTQGGRRAKAANGGYAYGSPSFGCQAVDGELVASESEQQTIDIIRRHHKSGKSLRAIADYLNSQGLKSKRGKAWAHTSVKSVLDRLYA
jgi:site-specific DNA recombinase